MSFVDEVTITVAAGAGGKGVVSWHREPYKPKGGPDGGDGGPGGSVVIRAEPNVGSLLELRDRPHVKAERGGDGQGGRRSGTTGSDRIVLVPPGTVIFDDVGVLIADLANPGDEIIAARGGRGGRGNAQFATATRRAPDFAEKGEPGETLRLRLELRLIADVGLVGFPNAGKSTLISRISAARPKIADYPFTTLTPNLGVVRQDDHSFVVADIPGLIPGAHEGRGLGDRFLRHVRRAALLVFLIDLAAPDRDPANDLQTLRHELASFDQELAERPSLVVASKIDVAPDELARVRDAVGEVMPVSAVTGEGIEALVRTLAERVARSRAEAPVRRGYVRHVVRDEPITVTRENEAWRVSGKRPENAVAMTDMDNERAVERLQKRLLAMGVERALSDAGAQTGDEVRIGEVSFDFEPEPPAPARP